MGRGRHKSNTLAAGLGQGIRTLRSRVRGALGLPNPKVFVIGRNKTGTTSLMFALRALGFRVGDQRAAELLMEDWGRRDFRRLIRLVHTADVFQDVPFSHDYTFQALDQAFPGSRFILSVRDDAQQWYESVISFSIKRFGLGRLPTRAEIEADDYVSKGWAWRTRELIWGPGLSDADIWDRERLVAHYERHNERVRNYFLHRPDDLLVLNVADPEAMQRLCGFLGVPWRGQRMPLKNASRPRPTGIPEALAAQG